tara:strand:+ start:592 stop:1215 length:624 start_codon:yes stop_codon:yes gene_type:complete
MNYERILSWGDIIKLEKEKFRCDPNKLLKEISEFEFAQYNPRKKYNKRFGLSITSLDGQINGIDLDSIYEYNKENGTNYGEIEFNTLTDVYNKSDEVKKIINPWIKHIARSHVLHLPPGGFFPMHRDLTSPEHKQVVFRIIVPLQNCNPPDLYFMYENKPINFDYGYPYFLNTNKKHCLFSMNDCYFLVLNVKCNPETITTIISGIN